MTLGLEDNRRTRPQAGQRRCDGYDWGVEHQKVTGDQNAPWVKALLTVCVCVCSQLYGIVVWRTSYSTSSSSTGSCCKMQDPPPFEISHFPEEILSKDRQNKITMIITNSPRCLAQLKKKAISKLYMDIVWNWIKCAPLNTTVGHKIGIMSLISLQILTQME